MPTILGEGYDNKREFEMNLIKKIYIKGRQISENKESP
jgi:hypothetical protein